jgi:hypothetical protein
MSSFNGGNNVEQWLNDNTKRLTTDEDTLRVGFLEGSTYPNGTSVPMVAAVQEFGGKITIPAHDQSIFRQVNGQGDLLRKGKFVKRAKSNLETIHPVAEYTVTIPSRPYFRNMLADVHPLLGPFVAKLIARKDFDMARILQAVGEFMKGKLQQSIITTNAPALAASTIAKKGFATPLIDSQHMQNTVDFDIKEAQP